MNQALRKDAQQILASSLQAVLPDEAVQRALRDFEPHGGRVLLVGHTCCMGLPVRRRGRWRRLRCGRWAGWTAAWW